MENLMELDLYELIGTVAEASTKEIKTAYRKKALSCHPDKNPDNPRAAELFQQLSRALEILIDNSARAAYDKVLKARHQAKLRASQYDSKRKKLKDDLEAREEAYKRSQCTTYSSKTDEQKLKAEIERLKKEGSKQVEEENALVRQQIYEQLYGKRKENKNDDGNVRIKIRWKSATDDPINGGYDYETLYRIFSKYGDIAALVLSSTKKGCAMIEYKDSDSAKNAVKIEIGLSNNPLKLQGLWQSEKFEQRSNRVSTNLTNNIKRGPGLFPSMVTASNSGTSVFPSFSTGPNISSKFSDAEFESTVLQNMRRAEERKRLIEKLQEEET